MEVYRYKAINDRGRVLRGKADVANPADLETRLSRLQHEALQTQFTDHLVVVSIPDVRKLLHRMFESHYTELYFEVTKDL